MKIIFSCRHEVKSDQKKLAMALSRKGYRLTAQRKAVLEVIAASSEHLTPSEVHRRLRQSHPAIGVVTVYRTLQTLSELGLVCKVHSGEKSHSYTLAPSGHHHHMICSGCGKVVDFSGCDLTALEERLCQHTGFIIEGHLLQFSGICRRCQGGNSNGC